MTNTRKWYVYAIIDPPVETWNEGQSRSVESFDYDERKLADRFCEWKEEKKKGREKEEKEEKKEYRRGRSVISWTLPSKKNG